MDAPFRDGSEELQLPHDSAAAATFLEGSDPVELARLGTAGDNCFGCFAVRVLLLVATDGVQQEFDMQPQVFGCPECKPMCACMRGCTEIFVDAPNTQLLQHSPCSWRLPS